MDSGKEYFVKGVNENLTLWNSVVILYAIAGLFAAIASFLIELEVFRQLTGEIIFAFTIAFVFEICKVSTIIVYDFLRIKKGHTLDSKHQLLINIFRISLLFLSFICSLAIISATLDRPNLENVREKDAKSLKSFQKNQIFELKNQQSLMLGIEKNRHNDATDRISLEYEFDINRASNGLEKETNNRGVGGVVEGHKYKAYRNQLLNLRSGKSSAMEKERKSYNIFILEQQTDMKSLIESHKKEQKKISKDPYLGDGRVQNKLVSAALATINDGILNIFGVSLSQVTFVAFFSILIAFLLEVSIFLSLRAFVINFTSNMEVAFYAEEETINQKKN